jgi:hypothetical protein
MNFFTFNIFIEIIINKVIKITVEKTIIILKITKYYLYIFLAQNIFLKWQLI